MLGDVAKRDAEITAHASFRKRLYDHDVVPDAHWGRGHVTLLGDAAHAILPHLAQGAAMAIEDAYVLARHLTADSTDIPARLRAYEHERQKRTAQAQAQSRQQGRIYPMSGLAALARNAVLRRFGAARLQQRLDWIYSYRA
jgi:salicylate hydroxylase